MGLSQHVQHWEQERQRSLKFINKVLKTALPPMISIFSRVFFFLSFLTTAAKYQPNCPEGYERRRKKSQCYSLRVVTTGARGGIPSCLLFSATEWSTQGPTSPAVCVPATFLLQLGRRGTWRRGTHSGLGIWKPGFYACCHVAPFTANCAWLGLSFPICKLGVQIR